MPPSEAAPAVLDARGLTRTFGASRVLRGVDLRLDAGEALAVVGPNGAGKTTLLRLLAGLLRPNAGEVRIRGRVLRSGDAESRRPVGFVSHRSLLYDDLTLLENLTFAARLYGLARPEAVARRALEEVELGARAGESPRRLSRGMVQRAAIARALLHEPALLLLDEPFTGLDAHAAERFRAVLRARLAAGLAAVVVTHQPVEAWEIATRVAVLVEGRWALDEPRPADLAGFVQRYREVAGG